MERIRQEKVNSGEEERKRKLAELEEKALQQKEATEKALHEKQVFVYFHKSLLCGFMGT